MYYRRRITRVFLLVALIMAQRAEWPLAVAAFALAGIVHLLWKGSLRSLGRDIVAFLLFYGLLEAADWLLAGNLEL